MTYVKKVKKSGKVGQEKKTLITCSAQFLIANTKVLFVKRGLGTSFYCLPVLTFL